MLRAAAAVIAITCLFALCPPPAARAEPMVRARQHLVIAGHPEATRLGDAVLDAGGNAADALVTVSLALGVAEPGNSGLGGKLVILYYDAASRTVQCMVALESTPMKVDVAAVTAMPPGERTRGWNTVCTPALPAGLAAAHERWGSRPWAELVAPAAKLAEEGFVLSPLAASMLAEFRGDHDAEAARLYEPRGRAPLAGERFANPDLARTLRLLADGGAKAFYEGLVAEAIVSAAGRNGSPLSLEDFRAYRPRFLDPLKVDYRGATVYSAPPPLTGGATVLAAMATLEQMGWPADAKPRNAAYIDAVGRVLLQVYPEVARAAGDAPDSRQRVDALLAPESIARMAEAARTARPRAERSAVPAGAFMADDSCTTHLLIVDRHGNIACATQSLGYHFGAAVVAPGTGVLLNNALNNLAFASKGSVNYVAPGRWPRSTIAPTLAFRDGRPVLAVGAPGGQRIPTAVLQVTLDVLDFGRPLDEAVFGARMHVRRATTRDEPANIVDLDPLADPSLAAALEQMGWKAERRAPGDFYFGAVNAALFLPDGTLFGVADQRRTGDAEGD